LKRKNVIDLLTQEVKHFHNRLAARSPTEGHVFLFQHFDGDKYWDGSVSEYDYPIWYDSNQNVYSSVDEFRMIKNISAQTEIIQVIIRPPTNEDIRKASEQPDQD
jgi:hypothetical protein